MKKFLYALLVLVGFAIVTPAVAQIGHRGENPTVPQNLRPAGRPAGQRYGHEGENPTTRRFGHRGENPNANNWQQEHKGIRAISGTQYPR